MNTAFEETRLILNAIRPCQDPHSWEADRVKTGVSWRNLVIRAIVIGLAPQLHHHLSGWNADVPTSEAVKLKITYEAHTKRNAMLYRQLKEVLAACQASRIQPIVLKGMHLSTLVYPDPGRRPMNDIDILISPEEIPEVEDILQKLGYEKKYTSPHKGPGITKHTSTFSRNSVSSSMPNPYLSGETEAIIEPHSSVEESWFGLKVDVTPGLRDRALMAGYKGQKFRILAPEDLLLYLSVHFCFHLIMGKPLMVQLLDLQMVINKRENFDWYAFVSRAKERKAVPYVCAALRLVKNLLAADVPPQVEEELMRTIPPRLRRRVMALNLAELLHRSGKKPLGSVAIRLARGIDDRREAFGWAVSGAMRWDVIVSALRFWHSDTARFLIKRDVS